MNAELKTITPAIAKEWLEKNIGNRPLKPREIEKYCKLLKKERWKINGDTFRISKSGRLLDGQNRLHAIIKTGIPIQSWVIYGLDDDVFPTIDVGKRRSGADTFHCLDEKNTTRLAAALALVDRYMTGRVEARPEYTNTELVELLEKYPEIRESIVTNKKGHSLVSPRVVAACHYLFSRKAPVAANRFMDRVINGAGLEVGDPEYALREKLVADSRAKSKLSYTYIFGLFILAWNHSRVGLKRKRLWLEVENGKVINFPEVK